MKSQNSITVTWNEPLTTHGPKQYIGHLDDGNPAQAGAKDISYRDPSGHTQYANPYEPGTIEIMPGSSIILGMVAQKTGHNALGWGVIGDSHSNRIVKGKNNELLLTTFKPKTSQMLSACRDIYDEESHNLEWCVHSFNADGSIPKV